MGEKLKTAAKTPETKSANVVSRKPETASLQSVNSPIERILSIQRTIGNQAVQRLFESGAIQAKLKIGQPGDKNEQEADRIAEQVMRMPEPQVQRQPEEPENQEDILIQTKLIGEQITPLVQRRIEQEGREGLIMTKSSSEKTHQITNDLSVRLNRSRDAGKALPEADKNFMGKRFGIDFSDVRVHTDSEAALLNKELNAQAFTCGRDIYFGAGNYCPTTMSGKILLAHELTHVVQQGGTVRTFRNVPAQSGSYAEPVQIMRRETDIIMRSPICPNTVMTFGVHPISERINNPRHGRILLLGGVAQMEVGEDRMCVLKSFNGERLTETVTIRSNNCPGVQQQQLAGGTFTVGTGTSVGRRRFPALQNTFYDHHQMGILDNPGSLRRWRSRNCQIIRNQRYSCNGVDISSHELITTFRPVSSGDPNVTVVKRDINSCLPCGRSTP
jgi:hypothetical protein